MCTIDKMLIKGIRSFSPDNQHVIEFYKPLTLIVGQNGAGKTTIIECLKQACTGDLPPNTRSGQSFIHDPKVAGENEVKAQIKLRFKTATGQPVVIIRAFQLTQKKTTLQFKALDQTLQTINRDTNKKEALSYRCADMDRIVPSLMGVSKAILENVIFVHQEESNWPLAEGQTLKKKFDDIFAATKYTKALEALRKLRTEKMAEVKEFKLRLEHLRTHKDNAARLRKEVQDGETQERKLLNYIRAIEDQLTQLQQVMDGLDAQLGRLAKYDNDQRDIEARLEVTAKTNAETRARLAAAYGEDDIGSSVEELEEFTKELDPTMRESRTRLQTKNVDLQREKMNVEAEREQYERAMQKLSRLTALAEAHIRNVADRDRFIRELVMRTGIMPLPANGQLTPGNIAAVKRAMQDFEAKLTQEVQALKTANASKDDEMGRLVDGINTQMAGAREGIRAKKDSIRTNESQISRLQAEMSSGGQRAVSRAMLEEVTERERLAEAQVPARQTALEKAGLDKELQRLSAELTQLQGKSSALRQERERLAVDADKGTRLRMRRQDVNAKEAELDTLIQSHKSKLETLLKCRGKGLPQPEELKGSIEVVLQQLKQDMESKAAALRAVQSKHSGTEALLNSTRSQLQAASDDCKGLQKRIQQGLNVEDSAFPERVEKEEREHKEASTKHSRVAALGVNIDHFKKVAVEQHKCQICDRPLNDQELKKFLRFQDQQFSEIPVLTAKFDRQLAEVGARLQALRELQPTSVRCQALAQKDIPQLRQHVQELEAAAEQGGEALDTASSDSMEAQHAYQEAQKLHGEVVWQIDRLAVELAEARRDVQQLSAQARASGSQRTVGDVDADMEALENQRTALEREKDTAMRKLERLRNEVNSATHEWHQVREEAMRKVAAAERRSQLDAQVKELETQCAAAHRQIQELQRQMQPLEAERAQRAKERDEQRTAARAKEAEAEGRLREAHAAASELRAKLRPVEEYQASDKEEQQKRAGAALEASKQRLEANDERVKAITEEIGQLTADVKDHDNLKRQLDECIAFQRNLLLEKELEARHAKIAAEMGSLGDNKKIREEYAQHETKKKKLCREQDMARGSLGTVREGMKRANDNLSAKEYRDIDALHRKQLIEVKTTEMAASDLDKYHKALEKALLAFHTAKMADINKIVKELWQKTYRNQDIDYIQIVADADHGAARSYNYRVVMVAGGAELDMRGRCSAGQKVLACLIIRLALAETFCLNCGILALDEPTTNLDEANSASLADALRQIMAQRAAQANFQLVVITHDERFAHMIGTREHVEFMWRITKDQDQHSHIAQEQLLE